VVILVDDGLATGSSMRVAIEAIRGQQPDRTGSSSPYRSPRPKRVGRFAIKSTRSSVS
jgi:predicted phosphoribosyltransferase